MAKRAPASPEQLITEVETLRRRVAELERQRGVVHDGESLRKSEERFRLMAELSPDSMVIHREGRIFYANPAGIAILGATAIEDTLGRHILDFVSEEDKDVVRERMLSLAQGQERTPLREQVLLGLDGRVRIAEVVSCLIPYQDGDAVLTVGRDITDRKRVADTLRDKEAMLSAIAGAITDGLNIVDEELNIVWANERLEAMFGPNLAGRKCYEAYHGRTAPCMPCGSMQTFIDGGIHEYESETVDRTGAVRRLWVTSNVAAWHEDGSPRHVVEISRDITDWKQTEEALREAKRQAEAANRAKSQFLANMSHELRTPLNGILGMLQLLEVTPLHEEQKEYLLAAVQSSRRLARLLSDILDLSRVEAGKLGILFEPFDLTELLRQVEELFRPISRQTGISLHAVVDPALPAKITGDGARLQQILGNLLGNAFKFTTTGSVRIQAEELSPRSPGECRILFSVADTGIGIPDDKLARIFEPFTQVSEGYARQYQGAGLGLSICKRLIGLMGGEISVASEVGKGTTVYFCLPFVRAHPPVPRADALERAEGVFGNLGLRVLLAEDDMISSMAATRLLEKASCEVIAVEDGQEALVALERGEFDVVLMDVQMPVLDGVEATRAIRNGAAGKEKTDIPIIALTAYAMTGDREKFLQAGMDGYVAKPLEMEVLTEVLEGILARRAGTLDLRSGFLQSKGL